MPMTPRLSRHDSRPLSLYNPLVTYLLGWAILCFLAYLDYATGDYSLIVFYLVPVALAAWFAGRYSGLFFCLLVLGARIIADESASPATYSHSLLHYWNVGIECLFLIVMSLLFSTLRRTLDGEKRMARVDPLTGALNRRSFFELADYELIRSRRYGHAFCVAYIDLDDFKQVNDTLGHHTGDQLLGGVVACIRGTVRKSDLFARLGGDEFVLFLPETSSHAALALLNKLHGQLNEAMAAYTCRIGFSIGAVTYLTAPATMDEVLRTADDLMYQVKQGGKNKIMHTEIR